MATVTSRLALPANGVSPTGTLTNSTALIRLSVALAAGSGPGSWQLIKQNADSTAWYAVPNAVLSVGDDGGTVGQLNWADNEGSALYHVMQTRPSGQAAVMTGATVYLSASSLISSSVGAVTTTTLTASGAIVGQSTLAITGASTLTGDVTMSGAATVGTTLGVTGAVTHASTLLQTGIATFNAAPVFAAGLTASGAIANNFSGSTGTFLTSSGANTLSGTTTLAANKNFVGAAGTGALTLVAMTGDWSMPNGAGSWVGASGKSLTLASTSAAMSLTAGGVLTMTGTSLSIGDGTVTQGTSVSTTVVCSESSGVITTFSQSAAAGAVSTFTVTNTKCLSTSVVLASVGSYAGTYGTNGFPIVSVSTVSAGSFAITVINAGPTNALSGVLKINFAVL